MHMMQFRNIVCCSIIRTNHLSEPHLVLINSDNRRSTVNDIYIKLSNIQICNLSHFRQAFELPANGPVQAILQLAMTCLCCHIFADIEAKS